MNNFAPMADMINAPLLLDVRYVQGAMQMASGDLNKFSQGLFPMRTHAEDRELQNGVAIIRVQGSLYHRGWQSYEQVELDLDAALAHPGVKGIVFDIDSPGGVAAGVFDLSDRIFAARGEKPMLAIVNQRACSAAYAIASACDRISVSRTSDVGSVGVVLTHWDLSAALERWGERVTLIFEGAHKTDGNPFEPLPTDVRDRLQADVKGTYDLFVETVARNRGMSVDDVVATQALVYSGEGSLEVGFADSLSSSSTALNEFSQSLNNRGMNIMKLKVSDLKEKLGVSDEDLKKKLGLELKDDDEVDLDDIDDEEDEQDQAAQSPAGDTQNLNETTERQRVKSILECEHAAGREEVAQHLALNTSMTLEEASAVLEKTPKAASPFTRAMENSTQPDIGDDALDPDAKEKVSTSWITAMKRSGAKLKVVT